MQHNKQKYLEITQIMLGQEVIIKISLEQDNIIQKEDKYYEPIPEETFYFLRTNFYSIISRVPDIKFSKSTGGTLFCYAYDSQPHEFSFIFDKFLYYFHFGINEKGQIVIDYSDYKTKNLKSIFDTFLGYLDNCSDKDYYSYYSRKLEEI